MSIDFRNIFRFKVLENPSSGGPVPFGQRDGRTGRHVEANSRFSQFCERAYKDVVVIALLSAGDSFAQYALLSVIVCMSRRI